MLLQMHWLIHHPQSYGFAPVTRPWRWGSVLLLGLLLLTACGDSEPEAGTVGHGSGADHDAEMARDAEAALQQSLAEASGKPPVIELEEVIRRTQIDSATAAQLTPRVAALNAALVRLVDLHRAHDSAQVVDAKHQIDAQAYAIHLEADTYENDIHGILTEDQHRRFHEYLEERAAAVGLPLDDSHGAPGVGTMGGIPSVGHPDGAAHGDTMRPPIDTAHAHRDDRTGSQ